MAEGRKPGIFNGAINSASIRLAHSPISHRQGRWENFFTEFYITECTFYIHFKKSCKLNLKTRTTYYYKIGEV